MECTVIFWQVSSNVFAKSLKTYFCFLSLIFWLQVNSQINVSDPFCVGERVHLNSSQIQIWDFCTGDFLNLPSTTNLGSYSELNSPFSIEIFGSPTNFKAFVPSFASNELFLLSFSNGLHQPPTVTSRGNLDGLLDGSTGVSLLDTGSDYVVFVLNQGTGDIIRFSANYDGDIIPFSPQNLGNYGILDGGEEIELFYDGTNYYLLVNNRSDLTVLSFGADIFSGGSVMSSTAIPGGPRLWGIDISSSEAEVIAFLSDFSNGRVFRLIFSGGLSTIPSIEEIDLSSFGMRAASDLAIVNDQGVNYVLVQDRFRKQVLLDYGQTILGDLITIQDLGEVGGTNNVNMTYVYANSVHHFITLNFRSADLNNTSFSANCNSPFEYGESTSVEFVIENSDDIPFQIRSNDFPYHPIQTDTLKVLESIAPQVDFSINSICINSLGIFTPSLPDLTSYTWNFGDGSPTSAEESPEHTFSSPGTYTVRLDVNDGTCSNFTEQEITIYEEPPVPEFTPSVTTECLGVDISFTNNTDESQHPDGVLEYAWDFNGEGTSTEANPSFSFETAGTKDVTVTASIPGCETISEVIQIEVSPGPTSSYTASAFGICAGDIINFADASTGDPVTYAWNFGDGSESTAPNPSHLFKEAGIYNVSLTVQDALGCENTVIQEVAVSSLPEVDFDFEVPCTGELGVQFEDLSTVAGASIATRSWFINDIEVANADDANPNLVFPEAGTFNVRLQTVSTNGCENSYNEDITILESPQPDFSINIGCLGEVSSFADVTNAPGNPITGWFWTLDNTTYTTQEIDHTFSGTGVFDITLEVTGQNFCSETITRQVEVLELPSIDFAMNGNCSNELIQFQDQSVSTNDPISSRTWLINGVSQGTGPALFVENLPEDNYDLTLEVTTASGCVISSTQPITIDSSPEAALSATKDFGVPGETLTFSSISVGTSTQQWFVNESSLQTEADQSITFDDPGIQTVSLVVENQLGCKDSTVLEVLIATPEVDLSIGQFEVLDDQGVGNVFVEIINNSNLPVERTEVVIELENQLSVTEEVNELIGIGESRIVNLNVGIPLAGSSLSLLCVSLNSQYSDYADLTPIDNEKCISIQPQLVVESPFPNPVREETRVKLTAEEAKEIQLEVINSTGKIEFVSTRSLEAGLNNIFIRMADLEPGIYFIRIFDAGSITTKRIVKL